MYILAILANTLSSIFRFKYFSVSHIFHRTNVTYSSSIPDITYFVSNTQIERALIDQTTGQATAILHTQKAIDFHISPFQQPSHRQRVTS